MKAAEWFETVGRAVRPIPQVLLGRTHGRLNPHDFESISGEGLRRTGFPLTELLLVACHLLTTVKMQPGEVPDQAETALLAMGLDDNLHDSEIP